MEHYIRTNLTIIVAGIIFTTQNSAAQNLNTDFKDDLKKKEGSELKLNEEAIKLIKFDFMHDFEKDTQTPLETPLDKSWMEFKVDLAVPKSMTDTTRVRKPDKFIRLLPYSIWTKFGEDPVYDVMVFGNKKKYEISWTINPFREFKDEYGKTIAPSAGSISDGVRIQGTGFAIGGLDIMGFVYYNLTPKGRMLKHNSKHAIAWKTYRDYQPTLADSLKFPTFYSGVSPIFDYNKSPGVANPTSTEFLPDSVRIQLLLQQAERRDSLREEYLEKANEEADKNRKSERVKKNYKWNVRKARAASLQRDKEEELKAKEEKMIEELPGSMDSIYNYMRKKEEREAAKRAEEERIRKLRFGQE